MKNEIVKAVIRVPTATKTIAQTGDAEKKMRLTIIKWRYWTMPKTPIIHIHDSYFVWELEGKKSSINKIWIGVVKAHHLTRMMMNNKSIRERVIPQDEPVLNGYLESEPEISFR